LPNMVELIKQAAVEAVNEAKPTSIVFGEVKSIDPLQIAIDQKLILTSDQLILTNNVRDYDVQMTVDSQLKIFTVHNALILGDRVMMIQVQGGQKFIVIEKVVVE
jgi:hypothetical protein